MGLHFVFKNISFSSNSSVIYFINLLPQDGLGVLVQITGSSPQRVCEALARRVRPRERVRAGRDHEFENHRGKLYSELPKQPSHPTSPPMTCQAAPSRAHRVLPSVQTGRGALSNALALGRGGDTLKRSKGLVTSREGHAGPHRL